MKKITKVLLVVFLVSAWQVLSAQEVILIEKGLDDKGLPTLYDAIMGDTIKEGDNIGDRAHPNAIYRLTRGQIYPSHGLFIGFNITIDALADDPGSPTRPPMIVPFPTQDELPYSLITATDTNTMVLKNLMFNAVDNPVSKKLAAHGVVTKSGRTIVDNCVLTAFTGAGINASGGNGYDIHISNCTFRNIQSPGAWWEADSFISWATNGDSLVFKNNTFFNCGGHISNSNWEEAYTNYFEFSNNTVFGGNFNILASFSQTNSLVTDNLFANTYAMGIDTIGQASNWCDFDGLTSAIVPVDTNDAAKMLDELGLTESDRYLQVHNNVYFWSQGVKDHWASFGDKFPETVAVFMNERDLAMFANDEAWPLLDQTNNIEEDPMFVDTDMQDEVVAGYTKYGQGVFANDEPGDGFEGYLHHYPDGDGLEDLIFMVEWPLAENLAYTSATVLKASSTGGPVGDPRWVDGGSSINTKTTAAVELNSYPNPFTTETTIDYTLDRASNVIISVIDIMGKELTVLVNETKQAGNYSVNWDGTNMSGSLVPAGVYFYQLHDGNTATTKRMIKIN